MNTTRHRNMKQRIGSLALGLVVCFPLAAGCASQKELKQYQDEVVSLREERTQLKKENRALKNQLDSYSIQLADANQRVSDVPEAKTYDELDAAGVDYGTRGGNFVISLPDTITFPSGKAELTKNGKSALESVARVLKADYGDGVFWIEGHTDNEPIKKSKWTSNRELSVMRAMAVLHYIVEDCEVADDRCVVAGHGEYAPVAANESADGKSKNRRVEIIVHQP